jgi:DNA-binding MarR family transcriptional regulator
MPKKRAAKPTAPKQARAAREPAAGQLTVSLPQFLVNGSDLKFRELVADLFAAVAGLHALRRALASGIGLSAAEFSVILATWHLQKKGTVGISTIAKELHVAAANVTAEVGQLTAKGLLRKAPDPRDTRAVLVELTEDGNTILGRLTPVLRTINDKLFSGNRASDAAVLSRFLRHLAEETPQSIRMAKNFAQETGAAKRK